jgi:outer membrane protein OmpA-like peptidoglycan-associated protein
MPDLYRLEYGEKLMRASSTFIVGAVMGMAASSAVVPPAGADPAYSADKIINTFAPLKRSFCVGTTEDCKKQEAAEAPSAVQAHFDLLVNFAFNSDELTPAAKENLDQFAKALKDPRLKGQRFEIDGHTDAVGTEIYNQGLSERRAAAVVSYLAAQGLDPSLLIAKGFGKTQPRVADPYSPENRRVETHIAQ